MKTIRIPFARRGGRLVHIAEIDSGRQPDCRCVECGRPLIAKKGRLKEHHFAHDPGSNCNAESALHRLGKELLAGRLEQHLSARLPLPIRWRCATCGDEHHGDLLKRAHRVVVEYDSGAVRADLALLDEAGRFYCAMEIVVTHAPEDGARAYYANEHIQLIEFHLRRGADLLPFREAEVLIPSAASTCLRPKCSCGGYLTDRKIHIVEGPCWRCERPMLLAFVSANGVVAGPQKFTDEELKRAKAKGVIIEQRIPRSSQSAYNANICRSCHTFCGSSHLHDYFHLIEGSTPEVVCRDCSDCDCKLTVPGLPELSLNDDLFGKT